MSVYAILIIISKRLKLLNSLPFIKNTLVNHVYIRIWSSWPALKFHSEWRQTWKLVNLQISAKVQVCDFLKNLKMTKLLNSLPFNKRKLVNHVYIRIWTFWLTFTVLQWMKTNFKISQFSRFLLRSKYLIHVTIWKWLKLLNSVPFFKKTIEDQVYIRIWSFWLTFTIFQWIKKNSKISQFSSFLLRPGYAI